jgi:hypothetical protein
VSRGLWPMLGFTCGAAAAAGIDAGVILAGGSLSRPEQLIVLGLLATWTCTAWIWFRLARQWQAEAKGWEVIAGRWQKIATRTVQDIRNAGQS